MEFEFVHDDITFVFLEPRSSFDRAVIGSAECFGTETRVAYDYDKVIEVLMEDMEMEFDEARDWFGFNIIGSYIDENMPVFITMEGK